jgi:hypothetical protein
MATSHFHIPPAAAAKGAPLNLRRRDTDHDPRGDPDRGVHLAGTGRGCLRNGRSDDQSGAAVRPGHLPQQQAERVQSSDRVRPQYRMLIAPFRR